MTSPRPSTDPVRCARCGTAFGCGAQQGSCWCATVDVAPWVLTELDRRFDGCLCPSCLAQAALDFNRG